MSGLEDTLGDRGVAWQDVGCPEQTLLGAGQPYTFVSLLARVRAFRHESGSDPSHYPSSQPTWEAVASRIYSFGFGGVGGLGDKRRSYCVREQSLLCLALWSFWAPCGREGGHCFVWGDYPSYQEGT